MLCSAVVIHAIEQNLIVPLERQLNWALGATYFRQKVESVENLKRSRNILLVKLFLRTKNRETVTNCFYSTNLMSFVTSSLHESNRTKKIVLKPEIYFHWNAEFFCGIGNTRLEWTTLCNYKQIRQKNFPKLHNILFCSAFNLNPCLWKLTCSTWRDIKFWNMN